jgi:predicted MPP superfamily phosphohydrolase
MMPTMARSRSDRTRAAKYRRARIRSFLFTVGPNRLSGGRVGRRHLDNDIVLREIEATSPLWPEAFDGLRIGHVSDFHLGELMPVDRALRAIERLAAQEPDLIACTGDVVDLHHDEAMPVLESMARAGAPLGAILVLGNHDELHCADTIMAMASEAGMIMLHDDAVSLVHNGSPLVIAGIRWAKSADACARAVDVTCGDHTDLLLAHNPKAFMAAADRGIPLTLSGHTHGGQVALRNRPNLNLALSHRHSAGLFEMGPSRLFVTSGVGSWFPVRLNCPPEIAVITMRRG